MAPRHQIFIGFAVVVTFVVGVVVGSLGTTINASHQPEIKDVKAIAAVKVAAVEDNTRTIGRQNIAETTIRTSKTAGAMHHTSPPAVGVYEPGGRRVEWTSASSPLPCNILFIKVHKCASSTTSGVARRIAAHHSISGVAATCPQSRLIPTPEPAVSANHGRLAPKWKAMQGLTMRSFLWTMIRSPVSHCMSAYYFHLTANERGGGQRNRRSSGDIRLFHSKKILPAPEQSSSSGKVEFLRTSSQCQNKAFEYVKRHAADTPETLVPIPETQPPKLYTHNPQPYTLNPKP
jgi:hypothetical protein